MPTFQLVPSSTSQIKIEPIADRAGRIGVNLSGWVCRVSRFASFAPEHTLDKWSASRPTAQLDVYARQFDGSLVADAALEGRLYQWSWGEVPPGAPPPSLSTIAATHHARAIFDDRHAGLWLLTCWRSSHGAASIPIEVIVS